MEPAGGGTVRETLDLQQGISRDLAREISTLIRDRFPKVRSWTQDGAVHVTGKSTDDLQAATAALRERDYPVPPWFNTPREARARRER